MLCTVGWMGQSCSVSGVHPGHYLFGGQVCVLYPLNEAQGWILKSGFYQDALSHGDIGKVTLEPRTQHAIRMATRAKASFRVNYKMLLCKL